MRTERSMRNIMRVVVILAVLLLAASPASFAKATTVSDYTALKTAVTSAKAGDVITIGSSIACSGQIVLSASGVTLQAKSGVTPVLDFSAIGDKHTGTAGIGIYVTGSNNTIQGLIIQKAGDNGIKIEGAGNTIENCILRYNGDTGLQISKSTAANNTIKYCDSYRNCDTATKGENADGFACKLSAGKGNQFIGCRAFQNSDDGWDSYGMNNDVTYIDCITWHNGDKSITGYAGNGNGFKLGSKGSTGKRTMTRCIAFDTEYSGTKGFDQNNGVGSVILTDCLSFDNVEGYQLDKVKSAVMKNCREFGCQKNELPNGGSITIVTDKSKQAAIRKAVKAVCSKIEANCEADIITGQVNLDLPN
ncbi:right handed beta helix region [Lucifera butyrica]|uniref:Right handed beta helix region n=1 Tax=Lucifera butyrica TaxID=1351585 RepID=A0A498R2T1_9FIRM|nr:right-handed parallel beta-helix repeat-containing protein [Lucifera butyrica]VBB05127.1 right handed beta helix region [Lucifera butyrica]